MSKNPNGLKGKGGKDGKSGKGEKKAVVAVMVAKKPKKVKVAGKKPDSYEPAFKSSETLQTPQAVWDGHHHGLMNATGTLIRVAEKSASDGSYSFNGFTVANAPIGSELADLSGSDIYLTNGQLHSKVFHSKFVEGSKLYKQQYRIWLFLRKFFMDLGIAQDIAPKLADEKPVQKPECKTSDSVADFTAGVLGNYCFGKEGPCAVVALKQGVVAPQFAGRVGSSLKVELMSMDVGHPLFGYAENGTYVFHNLLACGNMPDFKGLRAGECMKLWEYLTDIIAGHRKVSKKAVLNLVAVSHDPKPGDKVSVPAEYREVLKAA